MQLVPQCLCLFASSLLGGLARNAASYQATRGLRRAAAAQARALQELVDDECLPKVALVGRPNVGKSALFNRLVRRRAALVYDTPASHVTRDYQEGRAQLGDLVFRVADTSGLEPRGGAHRGTINARATAITAAMLRQCHLTLLVLDAKDGVLPADEEVAEWLLRHVPRDQVLLVANKAEGAKAREEMPQTVYDCYRLGFGEPVAVSATTGDGLADLYTALQPHIDSLSEGLAEAAIQAASAADLGSQQEAADPGHHATDAEGQAADDSSPRVRLSLRRPRRRMLFGHSTREAQNAAAEADAEVGGEPTGAGGGGGVLKLAIMGLPNAGKSTLLNRLLGEERALTGPEPGLTRDAVRASWMYGNQPVELVDTAGWIGVGRTASYDDVGGDVAALSREATLRSLAQVHVALLVVDAERALRSNRVLAKRELSLASHVIREGKALVLVANKADVLTPHQRTLYGRSLRKHLSERFLEAGQLPLVEVSARDGKGVEGIMPLVVGAYAAWNKRVGTARLNKFIAKLSARMAGGGATEASLARIRYVTQIKARPPTFVAFLKGTRSRPVSSAFAAFLAHQIRDVLGFPGVPLRIWFRYRDRVAERKRRLVSIRSRRGQGIGVRPGRDLAGDPEEDWGPAGGGAAPGSIMADALRLAEELRRDVDEDAGEHSSSVGAAYKHVREAERLAGDVAERRQHMAFGESDAARDGIGSRRRESEEDGLMGMHDTPISPSPAERGAKRYMSPQLQRRLAAAAAVRGGAKAPRMTPAESEAADIREGELPRQAGVLQTLPMEVQERKGPSADRSASLPADSLRSTAAGRSARLQHLDDDDDDDDEAEGNMSGRWRWDDAPSAAQGRGTGQGHTQAQAQARASFSRRQTTRGGTDEDEVPEQSQVAQRVPARPWDGELPAAAATAAAAAVAAARSHARARLRDLELGSDGASTGGGAARGKSAVRQGAGDGAGFGGSAHTRAAMTKMLFSRKPSAPLVPEPAPRRSRKRKDSR